MAKKLNMDQINTGRAYSDTIIAATAEPEETEAAQVEEETQEAPKKKRKPRKEYTEEERRAFQEQMKTAGRKGAKMQRINLSCVPEIYEYIQIMARVRGESMTEFINLAMKQHMEEHRDIYEKALEFRNSL